VVVDDVLVEGMAGALPNDCNQNGIPDECDISTTYGGFCDPAAGPCDTDLNGNGVPDSCEVCGDIDFDGDVDADDYWALLDAYATCFPNVKYNPDADLDNDGCVGLTDFQLWLACYNLYNAQP
jgi:hypothetical protein